MSVEVMGQRTKCLLKQHNLSESLQLLAGNVATLFLIFKRNDQAWSSNVERFPALCFVAVKGSTGNPSSSRGTKGARKVGCLWLKALIFLSKSTLPAVLLFRTVWKDGGNWSDRAIGSRTRGTVCSPIHFNPSFLFHPFEK